MARKGGKKLTGQKKSPGQKKPPLTHFLCLPLVTPDSRLQLETSLKQFRDAVVIRGPAPAAELEGSEGGEATSEIVVRAVHPTAIRPVGALHCTLGVCSLDEAKLAKAVETLQRLDIADLSSKARKDQASQHSNTGDPTKEDEPEQPPSSLGRSISPSSLIRSTAPITVTLKGLVSMHPPHKTSILYSAPHDPSGRLYPFCLAVQQLFTDKHFLVPEGRKLKLHATIVNTIYAKGREKRPLPKWKAERIRQARLGTPDPNQGERAEKAVEPFVKVDVEDRDDAGEGEHSEGGKDVAQSGEDRSQGHGPNANAPLRIDATAILERFKGFVWAENIVLDRLAICEMGAKKIKDAEGRVIAEEYKEVASVKLPTALSCATSSQ